MSDQPCCACLSVSYKPEHGDKYIKEQWKCDLCGAEFIRRAYVNLKAEESAVALGLAQGKIDCAVAIEKGAVRALSTAAKRIEQLEAAQVRREPLAEGREHLTVTNEFQSDKYPWCPAGFVPLKVTDIMASDLLAKYAERRTMSDTEFTRDLKEALQSAGDTLPECEHIWMPDHSLSQVGAMMRCSRCNAISNVAQSVGVTRTGTGLCPYCDHRIANMELERESDGELHCNHCRGERQSVEDSGT